jgi:hypothetical protein
MSGDGGVACIANAHAIHRVQNDDGQKAAQPQVRIHDPMHRRPGFGRTRTSR